MDLPGALEVFGYMPAAFRNVHALESWANNHRATIEKPGGNLPKARFLFCQYPSLTQVWMKADKANYRRHAKLMLEELDDREYTLAEYDVDHVVARRRLREMWPDSWVLMQFCETGINRAIGSKVERKIRYDCHDDVDRIDIGLAEFIKLVATTMAPRGRLDIHDALGKAELSYERLSVDAAVMRSWFSRLRNELVRLGL